MLAATRAHKEASSTKLPKNYAPNNKNNFGKRISSAYGNSLHPIVKKTANTPVLWLESRITDTFILSIIAMHRGTKYLVPFQNSNHSFSLIFCWASILQVHLPFPFIKNDTASMTDKLQEEIQALMCDKATANNIYFCCKYQPCDPV